MEIKHIIMIGKSGRIKVLDISCFLPCLPIVSGSESIFNVHWMDARKLSNIKVINLIKGLHKIEAKYKIVTNNSLGFGSPSRTFTILEGFAELDYDKSVELEFWIASNGGNYYIKECKNIDSFKSKIKTQQMEKVEKEVLEETIDKQRKLKKEKRNSEVIKKDNRNNITKAVWTVGDYFSRMGGGNRPFNMRESGVYLLVLCKFIELQEIGFSADQFLDSEIIKAAEPINSEFEKYLQKISLRHEEIKPLVLEICNYANSRLAESDKSNNWRDFIQYVERME